MLIQKVVLYSRTQCGQTRRESKNQRQHIQQTLDRCDCQGTDLHGGAGDNLGLPRVHAKYSQYNCDDCTAHFYSY